MTQVTDCPYAVSKRRPYRDDPEEALNGYFEGDSSWIENNIEACIWFLQQLTEDPCL